jgi:fluoride exporter
VLTYVWIGLGSAIGGMGRYWCSGLVARSFGQVFPWGTIAVNVIGSLVIGFLATSLSGDGRFLVAPDARAFLMIGVCGGYTTFSSFSLETLSLLRDGEWSWAAANVVMSVFLCLVAVWLGHVGATALNR